jgi:hypothetical protein
VADPHESPAHDPGPHGNPADLRTADHTQPALDDPHSLRGTADLQSHTADSDSQYRIRAVERRGAWTEADQRRAFRLSWISTAIMGICFLLSLYVAYETISAPATPGASIYAPKAEANAVWAEFAGIETPAGKSVHTITLGIHADNLAAIMLVVVTLISLLVHIFSAEYMRAPSMHGGRFNR